MTNQNPGQIARDEIDNQLIACGWKIQNKTQVNLAAGLGVAVREYVKTRLHSVKNDKLAK